mmetsp:Transcript_8949/g.27822  ORF Transcript_8949/g.27822 Transcript_8949/m.27822 type:complete len:388 (-) Transcript_8949:74-1237(-)
MGIMTTSAMLAAGLAQAAATGVEWSFSAVNIVDQLDMFHKFSGAVAIGDLAIFAPLYAQAVGLFNTSSGVFSTVSPSGLGNLKFGDAAVIGSEVIFSPSFMGGPVGIFDAASRTFSAVQLPLAGYRSSFGGAVAVGGQVIFPPYQALSIGIFDVASRGFSSVSTPMSPQVRGEGGAFYGAVAVGSEVVFAPASAQVVGIFDVASGTFSTVDISDADVGPYISDYKFKGAAAVGVEAVFAPWYANAVGIFNVASRTFSTVDISSHLQKYSGRRKFSAAVAVGDQVIFAPEMSQAVGIFRLSDRSFSLVDVTAPLSFDKFPGTYNTFGGAVAIGNQVIFSPLYTSAVGILRKDVAPNSAAAAAAALESLPAEGSLDSNRTGTLRGAKAP